MKKTIMVHIDGIPTHDFEELGMRTVLQAAQIPHLDDLARYGELGRLGIPREVRPFAGELALLGLLGYDTQKWYSGPGAFEAMNADVILDGHDVAFLCDLATLRAEDGWGDGKKLGASLLMDDVSAADLETEDARELIDTINEQLVSEIFQFYVGHRSRHLMVWSGGNPKISCRNPQDALGKPIDAYLATGDGAKILCELMEASRMILRNHPVNQDRINAGLKPVNCLWLWGPGKQVELPPLQERWPLHGAVVSQSGPYLGVGKASGLEAVKVEDLGENESERLRKIADMASKILEQHDLACLHIPFSPCLVQESQSHTPPLFVEHLQHLDEHLIGTLRKACVGAGDVRLLVVMTPCASQSGEVAPSPVQYVLYEGRKEQGESSMAALHDQEPSALPLHNATAFFERLFGEK